MLHRIILELIRLLFFFTSSLVILYTVVLRALYYLLPDATNARAKFLDVDLWNNVLFALLFLGISWIISYRHKKLSVVNPLSVQREELFSLIISSIFLGYSFSQSFPLFAKFSTITIPVMSIILVFVLTQVVGLYKSFDFGELKTFRRDFLEALHASSDKQKTNTLILIAVIVILTCYSLIVSLYAAQKSNNFVQVVKDTLYIESITPAKTTYAYKVTLRGYNFGPEYDRKKQSLQSSYGTVMTTIWSEDKIEFVVPLQWKVGPVNLWIERVNRYDERKTILSNTVTLGVLNRWTFFPIATDVTQVRAMKRILRIAYLDYWNRFYPKLLPSF